MTNKDVLRALEADAAKDDMLILVDGKDRAIGRATKEQAHVEGLLHRAFSVVLVRRDGNRTQLLLSRRSFSKYHSGGLWANSCCSHPREGEEVLAAAARRLPEELGVTSNDLREIGSFAYRATFENGLIEHEYDHVIMGTCSKELRPNPDEVCEVRWVDADDLARELAQAPELFSAWAPMVLSLALQVAH